MKIRKILFIPCFLALFFAFSGVVAFAVPEAVHEWGPWVVDKEPTCTQMGHKHRVCHTYENKPHREDVDIPATGQHEYKSKVVSATCTEAGSTVFTCVYCGDTYTEAGAAALGHDYGPWKVVKEATYTEEGLEERVCSRDPSHVKSRVLPMLVASAEAEPTPLPSPAGFDWLNALLLILCVGSASGLSVSIISDIRLMSWFNRLDRAFLQEQRRLMKGAWGMFG